MRAETWVSIAKFSSKLKLRLRVYFAPAEATQKRYINVAQGITFLGRSCVIYIIYILQKEAGRRNQLKICTELDKLLIPRLREPQRSKVESCSLGLKFYQTLQRSETHSVRPWRRMTRCSRGWGWRSWPSSSSSCRCASPSSPAAWSSRTDLQRRITLDAWKTYNSCSSLIKCII